MATENQEIAHFGPGMVIANRYEVVEQIGQGAMGAVLKVIDRSLDNHVVALKMLFPQLVEDQITFARFRNEVLLTRELSHPNIIRLYDFGDAGRGHFYLSMEYIRGISLRDRIYNHNDNPILFDEALSLLRELCDGLSHAHKNGIIHRDLKPDNILLGEQNIVKITDFGLARTLHIDQGLTKTGEAVGTPLYMSPEQIRGDTADGRSDIYSLGIMGYELVMRKRPFYHDSWFTLAAMHLQQEFPSFATKENGIPKWYEQIIKQCAAKSPDDRPQTVKELFDILTAGMEGNTRPRRQRGPSILSPERFAFRHRTSKKSGREIAKSSLVVLGVLLITLSVTLGVIRITPPLRNTVAGLTLKLEKNLDTKFDFFMSFLGVKLEVNEQTLLSSVTKGDKNAVKILLNAGVNPNATNIERQSALFLAAKKGDVELVQILVEQGGNLNQPDAKGDTALIAAVRNEKNKMVAELLRLQASIATNGARGQNAFLVAAEAQNIQLVKTLIQHGANVNSRDEEGWTALMYAADKGNLPLVEILLAANANIETRNAKGRSAQDLFPRKKRHALKQLFGAYAGGAKNSSSYQSSRSSETSIVEETRLRASRRPVIKHVPYGGSVKALIETEVRNVGRADAQGIKVIAKISGAGSFELSGPRSLKPNETALYKTEKANQVLSGRIDLDLTCQNCRN